jgi:hypothetical protein
LAAETPLGSERSGHSFVQPFASVQGTFFWLPEVRT